MCSATGTFHSLYCHSFVHPHTLLLCQRAFHCNWSAFRGRHVWRVNAVKLTFRPLVLRVARESATKVGLNGNRDNFSGIHLANLVCVLTQALPGPAPLPLPLHPIFHVA